MHSDNKRRQVRLGTKISLLLSLGIMLGLTVLIIAQSMNINQSLLEFSAIKNKHLTLLLATEVSGAFNGKNLKSLLLAMLNLPMIQTLAWPPW